MIDSNIHPSQYPPPLLRGNTDWRRAPPVRRVTFPNGNAMQTENVGECPELILDAPGLIDDFYSSPIDWCEYDGCSRIAVALLSSIYIYNPDNKALCQMERYNRHMVTSVKFISPQNSRLLASGAQGGGIRVWDTSTVQILCEWQTTSSRIISLATLNENLIFSGSETGEVLLFDLRTNRPASRLSSTIHCQEICGLSLAPNRSLLASGSNDNTIGIWDLRMLCANSLGIGRALFKISHHSAAALNWLDNSILASGGGTSDRRIALWDASTTGALLYEKDTGSQITHLVWLSPPYGQGNLLAVAHGYEAAAENERTTNVADISIWEYSPLHQLREVQRISPAHSGRVLHLATIPHKLLSCGADETLRFWAF
ncbi:anaphase promoting complex protein [Mitosporidium daphniae]|uniref:Anaphase promoting complex protein n=1 Tax=Mitosporidium daphniae TaxID=1485682 RepID=A0A098VTC7_9MICR|nr:anaphase promoting complex protein [Mitosporidium daphniae]KGG52225.1 anaphase promoting complex protein [Mitosporidium daphniae]|eukprot:XP_013238690.1 anaphase promoting complex protein [Mitosporidium daphniae]